MRSIKYLLVLLIGISVSFSSYAKGYETINNKNIKVFMEILPYYRTIMEAHGADMQKNPSMKIPFQVKTDLDNLLNGYGMTYEEFSIFMQKVTMGYSAAQMEKNGIDPATMGLLQSSNLTPQELKVIKQNMPELDKVFQGK